MGWSVSSVPAASIGIGMLRAERGWNRELRFCDKKNFELAANLRDASSRKRELRFCDKIKFRGLVLASQSAVLAVHVFGAAGG